MLQLVGQFVAWNRTLTPHRRLSLLWNTVCPAVRLFTGLRTELHAHRMLLGRMRSSAFVIQVPTPHQLFFFVITCDEFAASASIKESVFHSDMQRVMHATTVRILPVVPFPSLY